MKITFSLGCVLLMVDSFQPQYLQRPLRVSPSHANQNQGQEDVDVLLSSMNPNEILEVTVSMEYGDLQLAKKAWKKRRRSRSPLLVPVDLNHKDLDGTKEIRLRVSQSTAEKLEAGQRLRVTASEVQLKTSFVVSGDSMKNDNDNSDMKDDSATEPLLLNQLKRGMAIKGRVVKVIEGAAFVNCGVVRRGKGDKLQNVDGFLARSDLNGKAIFPRKSDIYKPAYVPRDGEEAKPVLKRGVEIDVWIKEVRKQSGKLSVTLDDSYSSTKAKERVTQKELEKHRKRGLAVGERRQGVVIEVATWNGAPSVPGTKVQIGRMVIGQLRDNRANRKWMQTQELAEGDRIDVEVAELSQEAVVFDVISKVNTHDTVEV